MIGEMRDLETARIAVQSALTGHLVLSTLHTNDAAGGVTRLLDMGLEEYLLTSTVNASWRNGWSGGCVPRANNRTRRRRTSSRA